MDSNSEITVGHAGPLAVLFRVLAVIVALMMFAMMALTFVDVVGRYVFAKPVPGGRDFMAFIMGTLIFSAFPLLSRDNSHITVSLFNNAFRGRVRNWKNLLIVTASAGAMGFIAVRLWDSARQLHASGRWGDYLDVPIFPVVYGMAGLAFVAFAVLLFLVAAYFRHALTN